MYRLFFLPVVLVPTFALASAHDFVRHSAPRQWIEQVMPEDLPPLNHPSYYTVLETARDEAFHGRYKKALATLRDLADAPPIEVARIKGQALLALGRYAEALDVLSADAVAGDPDLQVLKARVLAESGRPRDAIAALQAHLTQHPDSVAGRYRLGALLEQVGDLEAAKAEYDWFVSGPRNLLQEWQSKGAAGFDDAEEVVTAGRALDRWATLHGRYEHDRPLHDTLLAMFQQSYDLIDRTYWPAHVAAAEYFLDHNDQQNAAEELDAANAANPNDARTQELIGLLSVENWNFDAADNAVAAMRLVNPDSTRAALLEARNYLAQRRPIDAAAVVQSVLEDQPEHVEAMGLLAAAHALQLQDRKAAEVLAQVEKLDPDNATAYFEVAEQLRAMRQYRRSEAMYKVAVERAPWWTDARNGLGLLYTQSGDEDLAYLVLNEAQKRDPFNVETTNYMRLLDRMREMARVETEHFIVLYDEQADPVIPEYFGEYLEGIYAEVCEVFKHEPSVKTIIEVFPSHDEFSVRTTGSPWIGTVGASTGRVIAMVAPRKGGNTMGPFNWADVLRHEFVHTVTLSATDNRIAHWMTEGLAVMEERKPLLWEWVPMLHHAVANDQLFTMQNLTWGFIRPKRPSDRSLAYAQSFWVCKYIQETFGHDKLLEMMAQFERGVQEPAVFQNVLGRSQSQFTEEFFEWAGRQVATWGYDEQSAKKYDALRKEAEGLIKARQYAKAAETWEQIAQLRPMDALPHVRLAGLYMLKDMNDPRKAIEHLAALHKVELHDNRYAKRIARIYKDLDDAPNATKFALEAVYINPYDLQAHELLAEMYEATGDAQKLERERRVIEILTQRDQQPEG